MDVLYISKLSSKRLLNDLFIKAGMNSGFAVHKFGRLITRGLVLNGVNCRALSSLPLLATKTIFYTENNETEDGVSYTYIPSWKIPILRHIVIFLYGFFYTLRWQSKIGKNKAIICDVLDISLCLGCLLASKISGTTSIGVMTDMPGLMMGQDSSLLLKLIAKVNMSYIRLFEGYVFLTEQMNEYINNKHRPYIIMEGLVDSEVDCYDKEEIIKEERVVMYAGGLHERYGLKMLVDAFVSIAPPQVKLVIYGNGPYKNDLIETCKCHKSVEYKGVAPNDVIVNAERRAMLLVNPRPTHEEFAKYSFPSKNMEYMVSGTPLLTTKLPGMPTEYYDYVFLFEEETESGYASTLKRILSLPDAELNNKGKNAQNFVLSKKNNRIQCERIVKLIKSISA